MCWWCHRAHHSQRSHCSNMRTACQVPPGRHGGSSRGGRRGLCCILRMATLTLQQLQETSRWHQATWLFSVPRFIWILPGIIGISYMKSRNPIYNLHLQNKLSKNKLCYEDLCQSMQHSAVPYIRRLTWLPPRSVGHLRMRDKKTCKVGWRVEDVRTSSIWQNPPKTMVQTISNKFKNTGQLQCKPCAWDLFWNKRGRTVPMSIASFPRHAEASLLSATFVQHSDHSLFIDVHCLHWLSKAACCPACLWQCWFHGR